MHAEKCTATSVIANPILLPLSKQGKGCKGGQERMVVTKDQKKGEIPVRDAGTSINVG